VPIALTALALAACGGGPETTAEAAAACLNDRGFLVQASGERVEGTAPDGVGFTLRLGKGEPEIDDDGNPPKSPGGPPARLSESARTAIEGCADGR
jgi:hypothetical protein